MKKFLIGISLWLIVLIVLTGCTKNVKGSNGDTEENKNKGGYVEEVLKVSDDLRYIFDITKSENGDLIVCASDNAFNDKVLVSSDNGVNWSEREIKHLEFEEEVRYKSFNLLNDGKILISYVFGDGINESVKYAIANEKGEVNAIDLEVKQETNSEGFNSSPTYFIPLNNGDFVYRTMDTNEVVQIDGKTLKEKFRFDGGLMYSVVINLGDKLIIQSADISAVYDMNTGESIENLTNELINNEQIGKLINSQSDKSIYNCFTDGLYSYDIEKNKNTLLIDDSEYITDVNNSVDKLIELEKDSYITLISSTVLSNNKLIKYSYDPNYVKVDKSDVVVYSLIENEQIRNKITMFESDNPDIKIKYEVGVSSEDGTQISDAIKTLNTEIMGGQGPDIILLDGLPVESLVENQVLADISDIIEETDKEVFECIVNSYKIDEEIYQLPLSIKIPILIGEKDVISKVNNLDSLLSIIKESSQKSDKTIFSNLGTPEDFIYSLYCIYGNEWVMDKKFNTDNLIEFMSIAKEIYNISKEKDDIYWKNQINAMGIEDDEKIEFTNTTGKDICPTVNVREVIYPIEKPLLGYGGISNNYSIEDLVNMQITKKDMDYKVLTKDNKNIFVPYNNIAINKNTKNLDLSKNIIKSFIEQNDSKGNFTIYKTSFRSTLKMNEESDYDEVNNHYVKYVERDVDEAGNMTEYPQYWANEDDINTWVKEIEKLNVPVEVNMTVLNEVATQFKKVIEEDLEVKTAVSNVVKKLEIYLAE